MNILTIITDVFQTPAIFISLIACVGLILQKKSAEDVIKGTFKAMIGILVLNAGVAIISDSLTPLITAIASMFPEAGAGAQLADYGEFMITKGTEIGLVMVIGFLLNVVIARFTKVKTVYMTGHMMFFYAMLWVAIGVESNLSGGVLVAFGTFCYLISTIIFPYLLLDDIQNLTGAKNFTVGHSAAMYCLLGARFGQLIGKPEEDAEKLNMPKGMGFLKDTTLVAGFIMILVYIIVFFMVSADIRTSVYGTNPITTILTQGMTFAGGMIVLLQGARLMMAEIVPSFKGISDRLVPGAIPALDIPLVFPYGSNSLMIGFVVSLVVSLITMFAINMSGMSAFVVLPATIACYFDVAPSAIFANNRGGVKAAVIWSALAGVVMMIIVTIAMPYLANTAGTFLQQLGANEESIFVVVFSYIGRAVGAIFGA